MVLTLNEAGSSTPADERKDEVVLRVDPTKHTEPFDIRVVLVEVKTRMVARLGFVCPKDVGIYRLEVLRKMQADEASKKADGG